MCDIIVEEGKATCWQEAIEYITLALYRRGYVTKEYRQACIARESSFPTGLPSAVPVALPHAAAEQVKHSCICVLRLKYPVPFMRMDDPDKTVQCQLVFCVAVKSVSGHLKAFSSLMHRLQDTQFMYQCLHLPIPEMQVYIERELRDEKNTVATGA